ncbi:hypothetical protein BaRGS_00031250, partial [Batillaria attramentaria]
MDDGAGVGMGVRRDLLSSRLLHHMSQGVLSRPHVANLSISGLEIFFSFSRFTSAFFFFPPHRPVFEL